MIEGIYPEQAAKMAISAGSIEVQRANLTVVENIDAKIEMLKAEIARLEASKATLGPLLDMKIRDIREAMQY